MNPLNKIFTIIMFLLSHFVYGQYASVPAQKEIDNTMEGWLGLYTKYRISKKLFYYGEYHYRRRNHLKDMANVYLRFGLTYLLAKNLEITGGVVTPFYWSPEKNNPNIDNVVPQFRLWQQIVFVQPFKRVKIYHQIRTEQRWKRDYIKDSPFELSFRFRYKISTYIPINNPKLISKTLFFSAYEEIFIQAGKSIIYNHFEDNRLFVGLGYIVNENIQIQAGYMWTFRHAGSPYHYENRHIIRVSLYHNFDFYKKRNEKKKEKVNTILNGDF